jgi:hypothetical protein
MDNLFLGRVVESTIQADLNRFRDYALAASSNRVPVDILGGCIVRCCHPGCRDFSGTPPL